MAGLAPADGDRATLRGTYVANLAWAAGEAGAAGVDILIEPINTRDIPRFFLNRQDDAHAIVAEVGAPNLKVQMDLYHCQIVEGDVAMKLRKYLPTGRVGHLQVAGVPERHEPDIGELNYALPVRRRRRARLRRMDRLRVSAPGRDIERTRLDAGPRGATRRRRMRRGAPPDETTRIGRTRTGGRSERDPGRQDDRHPVAEPEAALEIRRWERRRYAAGDVCEFGLRQDLHVRALVNG